MYFGLYRRGLWGNLTKVLQMIWCRARKLSISRFCDFVLNPFAMQQDVVNRKTASQTIGYVVSAKNFDIARCTLVHKRRKIWPEFRPTQRAVITHVRHGIATHSSLVFRAHYFDVFMVSISRLVDLCWAADARDSNAMTLSSVQSRHSCACNGFSHRLNICDFLLRSSIIIFMP